MARDAFIVGGSGQIGRAVAQHLLSDGWRVTVASRGERPIEGLESARHVVLDRNEPGDLGRLLGQGADALIDTIAYTPAHAAQLLAVRGAVGAFAVISSASVYADYAGRSLDEAGQTGFPDFPEPIRENQATVDPGPDTYSTRKVALERILTEASGPPAIIIRPCAIHGAHSNHPREWWFVKRVLDGRLEIPLNHRGESLFHTSAAANIAALIATALEAPQTCILNSGDPQTLTTAQIGEAIAAQIGWTGQIRRLDIDDATGVGDTPWSTPAPFVLDLSAGKTLGYRPATSYEAALPAICEWLKGNEARDWKNLYPILAAYPCDLFDYATEDALMAAFTSGPQ